MVETGSFSPHIIYNYNYNIIFVAEQCIAIPFHCFSTQVIQHLQCDDFFSVNVENTMIITLVGCIVAGLVGTCCILAVATWCIGVCQRRRKLVEPSMRTQGTKTTFSESESRATSLKDTNELSCANPAFV